MTPCPSNTNRAQRLTLVRKDERLEAWIAWVSKPDLDSLNPASFLSTTEGAQADAFRFEQRRESFLLGRLAAKIALSAFLGEPSLPRIEISPGVFGQPLVDHPTKSGGEISLSHSQGFAIALAFPREHPMALDVESIDDARVATVKSELQLAPAEQAWISSSGIDPRAAHILLWTAREALSKVLKCGLTCPFEIFRMDELRSAGIGTWESHYQNFHQYKCLSWVGARRVLSIALPRATEVLSVGGIGGELGMENGE